MALCALFVAVALGARAQSAECVGSMPVASFRLSAAPGGGGSPVWMPLRQLNRLPAGSRVRYQPGSVTPEAGKDAAMALVLAPRGDRDVTVLPLGPATATGEWIMPFDADVVLLVFAPQGFDEKRLTNLVTRDPALISSLVEYAEQTKDLEDTLEALRQLDEDAESTLESGRALTPTEQALLALLRALNPAASSFNPFGSGRRAGPTGVMGRGASMFFENAGGVLPGGGALPMVKQFLLPDTEFRSVYATGDAGGSMTLCAQRQPRSRNKIAYVWAYRLTNADAPAARILGDSDHVLDVAIGLRTSVPVRTTDGSPWDLLRRVTDWGLVPDTGGAPLPVEVTTAPDSRALRVDLRRFPGLPGLYFLQGRWDWGALRLEGMLRLHRLDELDNARLSPESQDRLVAGTGAVALDLTGANLRFVEQAWLRREGSERRMPVDLPERREGPAGRLRVEVNSDGLHPGPYWLGLRRADGATTELPVRVLPAAPRITSAALRVHLDETEQTLILTGAGLDQLVALEAPRASLELLPSEDPARRPVRVRLRPGAMAGEHLDLVAKTADRVNPLRFPGVLQVAPPRPRIVDVKAVPPADLPVTLRSGELPAGSFVSFTLRLDPAVDPITLRAGCDGSENFAPQNFTITAPGTLFFSLDPGLAGRPGCKLVARIETAELGASDVVALGIVVRTPRIDTIRLTNEAAPGGYVAVLEGWDLEAIERTGWSATLGLPVTELPRPVAGQGARQSLRVSLPWPSPVPKAPLYLWLRGEAEARATRVTP
jgi:hypothetical protein